MNNIYKFRSFEDKFYEHLGIKGKLNGFFRGALYGKALGYFKKSHYSPIDRKDNAKDLYMTTVQTLFIKTKQGKIKMDNFFMRSAYTIMRNKYIDLFRRKNLHKKYIDHATYLDKNSVENTLLEDEEEMYILAQCMSKIGEFCRKLLTLYTDPKYEKKQKEIAKKLNISQGQVSKRVRKCKNELNIIKKQHYG